MARTSSLTSRAVLALLVGYPLGWAVGSGVRLAGELALTAATVVTAFVALTAVERRLVRRGRGLTTVYAVSSTAGTAAAALTVGFVVSAQVTGLLRAEGAADPRFLPTVGGVGVVLAVASYALIRRANGPVARRPK